MKKAVVVDCPACGRKTPFDPSNRWRPFCSQRCKSLDLGAWAAERYRIAEEEKGEGAREKGENRPG